MHINPRKTSIFYLISRRYVFYAHGIEFRGSGNSIINRLATRIIVDHESKFTVYKTVSENLRAELKNASDV